MPDGQQVTIKVLNYKEHNCIFTRDSEGPLVILKPPRTLNIHLVSRVAMCKGCHINMAQASSELDGERTVYDSTL